MGSLTFLFPFVVLISNIQQSNSNHEMIPSSFMLSRLNVNDQPRIESLGNVTTLLGQRGDLKCRVRNRFNNTVVWLRHRDTHLLTAGTDVYTHDSRFRAFQNTPNLWVLRISSTRLSDGGVYECQLSTTPPISAFTHLSVVKPTTRLLGLRKDSELFINSGSTINLTCIVEDATDAAPKHIIWKHDSRIINFEWARGGISLVTEKKEVGVTISRLLIQNTVKNDSGTYICAPQNAHPVQVKVIVLEQGETQAAIQSGSSVTGHSLNLLMEMFVLGCILEIKRIL